jgi:6-phosphogluconolactonase
VKVERFGSPDELATGVATLLLARLAALQAEGRVPSICLTGGTIAEKIHREVARLTAATQVDWSRVDVWWGDERYVAADDPERNAGQAYAALLDQVPVDPARVHPMPADDGTPLAEAAEAYAREVREHGSGGFDILFLGVGPDGHVASLFPHSPQLDVTDAFTVPVPDSPKPPPRRISLTFEALRRTDAVWFVVTSAEKADAVAAAIGGADLHDTPAAGVTAEETLWLLDEAAAGKV